MRSAPRQPFSRSTLRLRRQHDDEDAFSASARMRGNLVTVIRGIIVGRIRSDGTPRPATARRRRPFESHDPRASWAFQGEHDVRLVVNDENARHRRFLRTGLSFPPIS
jgi:hypothetical protein